MTRKNPRNTSALAKTSDQNYNIVTPEFLGAFINVFKATAMKGQRDSKPKYSIRAVFMPGTDISALIAAAKQAADEKWGANKPKLLRSPFRKNEELETEIVGVPADAIVVTFSANEDRRPGVVDAKLQDILDEADCYSGAYYRAQVRAMASGKDVTFSLLNLQKLRDVPDGKRRGRMPSVRPDNNGWRKDIDVALAEALGMTVEELHEPAKHARQTA